MPRERDRERERERERERDMDGWMGGGSYVQVPGRVLFLINGGDSFHVLLDMSC